jgi:hypothetical protein
VIMSSPVLLPSIHLMQLYQMNSLAPTTNSTLPRIKFIVFPVSIIIPLKHLIRTRLRWQYCIGSCPGNLTRCDVPSKSHVQGVPPGHEHLNIGRIKLHSSMPFI